MIYIHIVFSHQFQLPYDNASKSVGTSCKLIFKVSSKNLSSTFHLKKGRSVLINYKFFEFNNALIDKQISI